MTIAKKYAQQYMPNGEVSLVQVIQAAIDEAGQPPDPVKLAELGWQMIVCPICGECAQAFPGPELAAQSAAVPVVGEPVAWGVTKRHEDNVWFISDSRFTAQYYAQMYAHRIGENPDQVVIPLYRKPTTSISTAELDALRKDAERLQYMLDETAIIMCALGTTSTMYRLEWPLTGYVQTDFHKSEREAIDAAIAGEGLESK